MKKKRTSSPPGNSDTFWDIIRSQAVLWLTHLVTTELHISTSGWPSLAISIQKNCKHKLQARFEFKTRQIMKLLNQKAKVTFFYFF